MTPNEERLPARAFVVSVSGLLLCLLFGFLYKREAIFRPTDPGFQFVLYGLTGALVFSVLKFYGLKRAIWALLGLFCAEIIAFAHTNVWIVLSRMVYFLGIGASVYLYVRLFVRHLKDLGFGKAFALGGLLASADLIAILIIGVAMPVFRTTPLPQFRILLIGQTFFGFLIGVSLGFGFEIGDMINRKLFGGSQPAASHV